jgi:hypothetical protein
MLALLIGALSIYLLSIGIMASGRPASLPTLILGTGLFISASIFLTASAIIDAIINNKPNKK